ncbi:hypothetical protein L0Y59_04195 [Candidatus Uhrbacteria bacterium]|nr:hypothetical protein [Candidatus Uhrbacteria bacterium]
MDAFLGRPTVVRRRKRPVAIGDRDDPAECMVALANVEAEIGCIEGTRLQGPDGAVLPSILDSMMTSREREELGEAMRAMRGFYFPRLRRAASLAFVGTMSRAWCLDDIEAVFQRAVSAVAPHARMASSALADETTDFEERSEAMDTTSRSVCLWSSLVCLAAECAVLKRKFHRPDATMGDA